MIGVVWSKTGYEGESLQTPLSFELLWINDMFRFVYTGKNPHSSRSCNERRHYFISPGRVLAAGFFAIAGVNAKEKRSLRINKVCFFQTLWPERTYYLSAVYSYHVK